MFYEKVEAYCEERKISLSAFEKKCGLGNGTIKGWINSNPRFDSLEKVAKEMGINVSELIGDEGTIK